MRAAIEQHGMDFTIRAGYLTEKQGMHIRANRRALKEVLLELERADQP